MPASSSRQMEKIQESIKSLKGSGKSGAKQKTCDVTGTQNFMQIMGMAVTRKKVDGGILFVKVYTNDGMIRSSFR